MYSYLKCIVYDKLLNPRQSFRITLQNHKGCTYRAPVRYVTKTWSVVLLNKKNIFSYLKYIVYDKLLKPRQLFWITLYLLLHHCNNGCTKAPLCYFICTVFVLFFPFFRLVLDLQSIDVNDARKFHILNNFPVHLH